MLEEGIAAGGEVLAPYVKALMLGGEWTQAIEVRKKYRNVEDESKIREDLGLLETSVRGKVGRTRAVLDGIVCEGLVNNGKAEEAIEEVFYALQAIPKVRARSCRFLGERLFWHLHYQSGDTKHDYLREQT